MRNFMKVGDVDVGPLAHALRYKPHLWNANDIRTTYPNSPHSQADDIILRFNEIPDDLMMIANDRDCFNYEAWAELPQVRSIVFDLMRRVEGEQLGRVLITRLAPGKCIAPHPDQGAPAEFYERYHVNIQSEPGAIFRCGDEAVNMRTGEVFWFDNQKVHSVENNSASDRITMIADIRPCR